MSYIDKTEGTAYNSGYFLANGESCTRVTRTIKAEGAITAPNGGKYVPGGTTYKETVTTGEGDSQTETEKIVGVVYEDVDVTDGDMPGSVVIGGAIYKDRLATPGDADALKEAGFTVVEGPAAVERPADFDK